MAKIYEHIELAPDVMIGRIDEAGRVYYEEEGEGEYIGRIDYEQGEVFDEDEGYMGWIEENGDIYGSYEEGDERLGRVADDGKLYLYDEGDAEVYVGQVTEMKHKADGAAAVLFFFDEWEEIFEDEEDEEEV
ncbi:MAG: hypothetical protein L6R45_15125 [Anaerolineae bacterium]|nr:hypothetical protein [Anaerolineae bacterium]